MFRVFHMFHRKHKRCFTETRGGGAGASARPGAAPLGRKGRGAPADGSGEAWPRAGNGGPPCFRFGQKPSRLFQKPGERGGKGRFALGDKGRRECWKNGEAEFVGLFVPILLKQSGIEVFGLQFSGTYVTMKNKNWNSVLERWIIGRGSASVRRLFRNKKRRPNAGIAPARRSLCPTFFLSFRSSAFRR